MPGGKAKPRVYGAFDMGLMIFGVGSKSYTVGPYTFES
jgi:hypothetical protein